MGETRNSDEVEEIRISSRCLDTPLNMRVSRELTAGPLDTGILRLDRFELNRFGL